jgi:hypothetical protein
MSAKESPGCALGVSTGQGKNEKSKSSGSLMKAPCISLHQGCDAIIELEVKFTADQVAVTDSLLIPDVTSSERPEFGPLLQLSDNPGFVNSSFGFGRVYQFLGLHLTLINVFCS